MTAAPKPGFRLVAKREWQWLLHDRAAVISIFGVPLFAFVVLTAVFSHPVIRGMGVVVVDQDRSETSRAFVEQVAASPGLSTSSAPATSHRRRARYAPARPSAPSTCRPISNAI
jgi:ABC-2 type transport system permease protein